MTSGCFSQGSHLAQLEAHLREREYNRSVFQHYVSNARRFLIYLSKRRLRIESVAPRDVDAFLRTKHRALQRKRGGVPPDSKLWRQSHSWGISILLRLVLGEWPPPAPVSALTVFQQRICDDYAQWLTKVAGLAPETVATRRGRARQFVTWLWERGIEDHLGHVSLVDIETYLIDRSQRLRRPTRWGMVACLRCFLRYLHQQGLIPCDLAPSISCPSRYAEEHIPAALRTQDIRAVLDATHQDRTPLGLRDFAILMLLSRYGIRSGEVIRLRLEDVDWHHEHIQVRHTKTGAVSQLPLLVPVGNALLDYLRHGRPRTSAREIFVRGCAPHHPLAGSASLYDMVSRRLHAAGIHPLGHHGPHSFRHAHAVSLLRAAVPLKTIGDLLGHRSPSSTSVYLKLATEDLRSVGLEVPWGVMS